MFEVCLNAIALVVPAVGHVLFWIGLVNRAHAVDLGHDNLHRLHLVHNVALVFGTIAWFVGVGLFGPRVLLGSWSDAPWPIVAAAIGFSGLAVGWLLFFLSRRLSPRPHQVVSSRGKLRNLEAELRVPIRGPGPYQRMQSLPGNEFLHLEVLELELRLPRCPPAWDGLSIIHLSDLHLIGTVRRPYFEKLFQIAASLRGDLVVFTGDLIDDPALITWFDTTFGILHAPLGCHFILGNHDREWGDVPASRKRLTQLGWQDASQGCRLIQHSGHKLAICGDERPWMGKRPDWSAAPSDAFRLLLSHTPDNLRRARQDSVDLMLAGHTHGGQVRLPVIGPVYAPSWHGVRFASGTFWQSPTLMHVSRGVAGRHPWRWNCPPELTRIVIHPADHVAQSVPTGPTKN